MTIHQSPTDMDPLTTFCPNMDCPARGHTARGNIKIHCRKRNRYRCTVCQKTFTERTGTPFSHAKTDPSLIVTILTLIAYGCPLAAIKAAFGFDRRTVRDWILKAGSHSQAVHEAIVLHPQVLQYVQADEIFVRSQTEGEPRGKSGHRWLYLFSAVCTSTRLWLGGLLSTERSEEAARPLAEMVRRAALPGPLLVVVDGLSCYKEAFKRAFRFALRTGRAGRPRLLRWSEFVLIQHVKASSLAFLACGTWAAFTKLWRRVGGRVLSTSYIERLNATFRERLAVLGRRTRHLARTRATLEASLYLLGAVYNFCCVHRSLGSRSAIGRTPAMAAGLTEHVWSVEELLWHRIPPERWRPPVHRGPLSKQEQELLAQWGD